MNAITIQSPSIPHFKGVDMRNLKYEIGICQNPIINSQCQCQYGNFFYDSDVRMENWN